MCCNFQVIKLQDFFIDLATCLVAAKMSSNFCFKAFPSLRGLERIDNDMLIFQKQNDLEYQLICNLTRVGDVGSEKTCGVNVIIEYYIPIRIFLMTEDNILQHSFRDTKQRNHL